MLPKLSVGMAHCSTGGEAKMTQRDHMSHISYLFLSVICCCIILSLAGGIYAPPSGEVKWYIRMYVVPYGDQLIFASLYEILKLVNFSQFIIHAQT